MNQNTGRDDLLPQEEIEREGNRQRVEWQEPKSGVGKVLAVIVIVEE